MRWDPSSLLLLHVCLKEERATTGRPWRVLESIRQVDWIDCVRPVVRVLSPIGQEAVQYP